MGIIYDLAQTAGNPHLRDMQTRRSLPRGADKRLVPELGTTGKGTHEWHKWNVT